jgi:hypothetical protein
VRYGGIEMTWSEDLNHNKPLHKAKNFQVEYALGNEDQNVEVKIKARQRVANPEDNKTKTSIT